MKNDSLMLMKDDAQAHEEGFAAAHENSAQRANPSAKFTKLIFQRS